MRLENITCVGVACLTYADRTLKGHEPRLASPSGFILANTSRHIRRKVVVAGDVDCYR